MTSAALITLPSTSSGTTSEIPKKTDVDARLTTIQTAINTLNTAVSKLIGGDDRLVSGCVGAGALGTDIRALLGGMVYLEQARLVATANRVLSGLTAIDGVTPVANDRILLVGQSDATQNGVWLAASGAWTRPADFTGIISEKTTVYVSSGVVYSGRTWCWFAGGTVGSSTQTWFPVWGTATTRPHIVRTGLLTDQSIPHGSYEPLVLATPSIDPFALWSAGSPTYLTIPAGWRVTAQFILTFDLALATSQYVMASLYGPSPVTIRDRPFVTSPIALVGQSDILIINWTFPAQATPWQLYARARQSDSGSNARDALSSGTYLDLFLEGIE